MLFNSYEFLFIFLPITLAGYQLAGYWNRRAVIIWLSLASLAFYAYWRPPYVILLCLSILLNYTFGCLISRRIPNRIPTGWLLSAAITVNIGALCYYKYLFPLLNFVARHAGSSHHWHDAVLPLGISFFTFTQIAYLVDLQQGAVKGQDLESYTLFATFFPHLIAGPILHHAEVMPQFQQSRRYRLRADDLAIGLSWFTMGLCKKVLLADRFSPAADLAFSSTRTLTTAGAWAGVLSYALQLYFDFSGYSDMALGLARMFSIDFPLNFSSPYKAASIIDFWQRWHMTLTRYINAYLYNPVFLAVSRRRLAKGKKVSRKAMTTPEGFLVMVALPTVFSLFIAGIWHGAGLQFVIFGLLHGTYLSINQGWRSYRTTHPLARERNALQRRAIQVGGVLLTFGAVLIGQVFFRASGVSDALSVLGGMAGLHAPAVASMVPAGYPFYQPTHARWASLAAGFFIVWALPNTQQILLKFKPAISVTRNDEGTGPRQLFWQPNIAWAVVLGLAFFYAAIKMQNPSTFLYFQF